MDNTEQIESKSRERMQVAAFHAIYKRFRLADKKRSVEEDFAEAITLTSDEAMRNADPKLIEQWQFFYDTKAKKKKDENIDFFGKRDLTAENEVV